MIQVCLRKETEMIVNRTCEDCTHYVQINYFFGTCEILKVDEPYCRPVDTCSQFKCIAFNKQGVCSGCVNKEVCYDSKM